MVSVHVRHYDPPDRIVVKYVRSIPIRPIGWRQDIKVELQLDLRRSPFCFVEYILVGREEDRSFKENMTGLGTSRSGAFPIVFLLPRFFPPSGRAGGGSPTLRPHRVSDNGSYASRRYRFQLP